jgi:predicted hydrocarbon binding protein
VFDFEVRGDDELLIGYKSARKMCALAEGFILGAAGVYREAVTIEQPQCMHRGADACLIHCRFAPLDA